MIQVVWEIEVKDGCEAEFELAFSKGGAWGRLFDSAPGFRGTLLLRDSKEPLRYLTIDIWDSEPLRDGFLSEHVAEVQSLEARLAAWTDAQTDLGSFQVRAESTVRRRPRGRQPGQ